MSVCVCVSVSVRWAEHFHGVLYQPSTFDPSVLDVIPDWDTAHGLMEPPDISEVHRAVNQMASGKAPGSDGLPPELLSPEVPSSHERCSSPVSRLILTGQRLTAG